GWLQLFFRAPPPQGVLALDRGDLLDGVGAADRAHAGFGHAEVLHLALRNQFLDRARHVLDRDVRVDTVLIIQIDDVGPESFQRTLDALLDALWAAVLDLLPAGITSDPELRGDHHLSAHRRQRFANELFVGVRTVDFGRIEECDAAFNGRADERDHRLLVGRDTVALAHPHAAEPEGRDFQTTRSQFAFLHVVSLGLHHHLDCVALVHGAVAIGNLIQSDDPIEHPARLDLALEHIGKQLLHVRSYRGRPAADREIVVERRLRAAMTAHRPTAPSPMTAAVLPRPTLAARAACWPVPITSERVSSDAISASSALTGRAKSVPSASGMRSASACAPGSSTVPKNPP